MHKPTKQALALAQGAFMLPDAFRNIRSPGWEWSVSYEGNPHHPVVWQTQALAAQHVACIERLDPEGTHAGLYSIDGSNECGTEFPQAVLEQVNAHVVGSEPVA